MDSDETDERQYGKQQKGDLYGRGSVAVLCFILVLLLVAGLAVGGLVLSILSFDNDPGPMVEVKYNRSSPTPGPRDEYDYEEMEYVPGKYNPDEVWLIQFDVDDRNLGYLDLILGVIKGYNIDVVNAVCRKANKNCRIVFDSYARCWSEGYGGEGLISRWYHACSGWTITTDRVISFKFTDPYHKSKPGFLVTTGEKFDWTDLTGKRIGFWAGWFTDPKCLNRQSGIQGLPLQEDQILIYQTTDAIQLALDNGEIDATFIGSDVALVASNVIASDPLECALEGAGMMMRKDTHLEKWWNPAWRALVKSDEYRQICDDIETIHGDKPGLSKQEICRDEYQNGAKR